MATPGQGRTTSASGVGDRYSRDLGTVVVSVPRAGAATGPGERSFENLNVRLGVFINNRETVLEYRYDSVMSIVDRSESRLHALVTEAIMAAGAVEPTDLPALRQRIVAAAQLGLDEVFSRWKYRESFEVEVKVLSMYFTLPAASGRR